VALREGKGSVVASAHYSQFLYLHTTSLVSISADQRFADVILAAGV